MVTKTHQPVSMPFGLFEEFDEALKGTRFDNNGKRNRSAAICEFMQSMIHEKRKSILEQQIKDGEALDRQSPTSDILQTNDEFISNQINKLMENNQDITDAVIAKQELDKQEKIYNYFAPICGNIMDRSQSKVESEQVKEQRVILTEEDKALLSKWAGRYPVPIEVTEVRAKLRKYNEQR